MYMLVSVGIKMCIKWSLAATKNLSKAVFYGLFLGTQLGRKDLLTSTVNKNVVGGYLVGIPEVV